MTLLTLLPLLLAGLAAADCSCRRPVSSELLQDKITEAGLFGNLEALSQIATENGGNRAFGLPGFAASVDYVVGELSATPHLKVWTQDFPALFSQVTSISFEADGEPYYVIGLTYSPSTSEEGITAPLVLGVFGDAGCDAESYEGLGVEGKIVLVERGRCPDGTTLSSRMRPAAAAGAAAVVIYNNVETLVTAGTLVQPEPENFVPCGFINQADGVALKERLEAGEEIEAFFQETQVIEERITQNVFAETECGDEDNVVMLGAHLDSVQAGPGINDDGSGTTLILEVAKAISKFRTNLKVRFGWWGAEENGLLGSEFYCHNLEPEEAGRILAYLNFDMVSRGYYGVFDGDGSEFESVPPPGSEVIEQIFLDEMLGSGVPAVAARFTNGSDYASFWDILGKPIGGLHTGTGVEDDPCYHQACDTLANPNMTVLTTNARAAAHVLSVLATDGVELIPKAEVNATMELMRRDRAPMVLDFDELERMGERHLRTCGHEM